MAVDSMSIIFKQFGVLEDFPAKVVIDKTPNTLKEMFDILNDGRIRDICKEITNNGRLKNDLIILKNGKTVDSATLMDTSLEDGDVIVLIVLTLGG